MLEIEKNVNICRYSTAVFTSGNEFFKKIISNDSNSSGWNWLATCSCHNFVTNSHKALMVYRQVWRFSDRPACLGVHRRKEHEYFPPHISVYNVGEYILLICDLLIDAKYSSKQAQNDGH